MQFIDDLHDAETGELIGPATKAQVTFSLGRDGRMIWIDVYGTPFASSGPGRRRVQVRNRSVVLPQEPASRAATDNPTASPVVEPPTPAPANSPTPMPTPLDPAVRSIEGPIAAAVLGALVGLFFLFSSAGVVSGPGGSHAYTYDCPGPARMLFSTDYIEIYPSGGGGPGSLTDQAYESAANAPGVYSKCRAKAFRTGTISAGAFLFSALAAFVAYSRRRA